VGQRAPEEVEEPRAPALSPAWTSAVFLALLLFLALLANGRPIDAGDTRPTERVAASLLQERDFDLDEYPDVEFPFAREVAGHRVSIYPVLSAVLALPVFGVCRWLFALNETGMALAGKLAASLFAAGAATALFLAVGRRRPEAEARTAAVLLALGTTLWSTSQALWQHPAATLFLALSLLCLLRAEDDEAWAGRAGLPLGLALAARHADVALVLGLGLGLALRWPRRLPRLLAWSLPGALFVLAYQWAYFGSPLRHGFSGSLDRFSAPWGIGQLGLLFSPAKGLLVFTPLVLVAVVGMLRAFRRGERWLALTLGGTALAHWLFTGRWSEWHGGESWGPRLMTDALPLLFLFLPEGLDRLPRLGMLLAAYSVAVQALGAFAYDLRWERLYQRPPAREHAELWSLRDAPIPFYAGRRVAIFALPAVRDGRAVVREHPLVVAGGAGSRFRFVEGSGREGIEVGGADPVAGDVHPQQGARVEGSRLRLRGRWDGLFLRVRPGARQRRLELRAAGRGRGSLYVVEGSFWSTEPRVTEHRMNGNFRIRHPYHFPESGGADLLITLGRSGGEAALESVGLLAPSDPENPIAAP
jgi:hypothetical protein